MNIILLYTTVATRTQAEALAQSVLKEKLAACVNISPPGTSLYLWQGAQENSAELYLLFKTLPFQLEALQQFLLKNHPYETPAIIHWQAEASEAFYQYLTHEMSISY